MKPILAREVINWQRVHGRHDLPWQQTRDPYRVWLSEIMLQQTQVSAVLAYYQRFLKAFPTLQALARATSDEVMAQWAGLGYYTRARNLHACARQVVAQYGGQFPASAAQLETLPGIGPSTAAAIAAFCFGEAAPILDGNVKRVFARLHAMEGWPGHGRVEKRLWVWAHQHMTDLLDNTAADQLPEALARYTQGLMDLGATLCTRHQPDCVRCPLNLQCEARQQGRVDELPHAKPAKVLPTRYRIIWLQLDQHKVWLTARPQTGIWGGLWSVPEHEIDAQAWPLNPVDLAATAQAQGYEIRETLPTVAHAFSHYKLQMLPVLVRAEANQIHEPPVGAWFGLEELGGIGVPAPIKIVLQQILSPG